MDSVFFDHANAFESAFRQLDIDVEFIRIPYFTVETLTAARLNGIRKVLKETPSGTYLIFCPGLAEFFLEGVDQQFSFSAYRSWCPKNVRVIPHIWTIAESPKNMECVRWTDKPPLRLGFMGTAYVGSKVGDLASRLPLSMKTWLLRGSYLKSLGILAHLYQ